MTYTLTNVERDEDYVTATLVRDGVMVADIEFNCECVDYYYTWINQAEEIAFDQFAGEDGMDDMIDVLFG